MAIPTLVFLSGKTWQAAVHGVRKVNMIEHILPPLIKYCINAISSASAILTYILQ